MRVLVTGGCGFIASHVVNTLVQRYPHYRGCPLFFTRRELVYSPFFMYVY